MFLKEREGSRRHGHGMERKLKKPLMEKRRRARINQCLADLKQLLLHSSPMPHHQRSKLEKADILEMTVAYLRTKRDCETTAARHHFVEGFQDCSQTVLQFVQQAGPIFAELGGVTRSCASVGEGKVGGWQTTLADRLATKLNNKLTGGVQQQYDGDRVPKISADCATFKVGLIRPQPRLAAGPSAPQNASSSPSTCPPPFGGRVPPSVPPHPLCSVAGFAGATNGCFGCPQLLNPLSLPPTPPFVHDGTPAFGGEFNFACCAGNSPRSTPYALDKRDRSDNSSACSNNSTSCSSDPSFDEMSDFDECPKGGCSKAGVVWRPW